MGLIYTAGYDYHGDADADFERYTSVLSCASWSATGGRFTGNGRLNISWGCAGTALDHVIDAAGWQTGRAAFYYNVDQDTLFTVREPDGTLAFFLIWGSGALKVRQQPNTTIGTTTTTLTAGAWYHIEIEWKLSQSGDGYLKLWLDGTLEVNLSDITLGNTGEVWGRYSFHSSGGIVSDGAYHIDDLILQGPVGDRIGYPPRIWTSLPESDVLAEWTRNTGAANYETVDDEDPDQATTYIESTAADDRDVYGITPPTLGGTIEAVVVKCLCTGGGNVRLGLTDGVNEDVSANISVDATLWKEAYYVLNSPPGGGSWTQADLNDVDVIVEASAAGVQVTQVWVETIELGTQITVTIEHEREDSVDASTSDFVAAESGSHTHTQWQIREADSGTIVYNPGDDATNLTSIEAAGSSVPLDPDTDYEIRARHKEDNTTYSIWSVWVPFSTIFNTGIRYFPVKSGDVITVSGLFIKENGAADNTGLTVSYRRYNAEKSLMDVSPPPGLLDIITWAPSVDGRRALSTFRVDTNLTSAQKANLSFISFHMVATGDTGETSGLEWLCGWLNPPSFGLSAVLTLDGSNVDLEWESSIPCRVKYIANTTAWATTQEIHDSGTFTSTEYLTNDVEEDIIVGLSGDTYVTIIAYDEDEKRWGPRQFVQSISN